MALLKETVVDLEMWLYQAALEGDALLYRFGGCWSDSLRDPLYRRRLALVQPTQVSKDPSTGSPPPTEVSQVKQLNGSSKSRTALWEISL